MQQQTRTGRTVVSSGNRLLDALCRESPALRRVGDSVEPALGTELAAPGRTLAHVYFPVTSSVSLFVQTESGPGTEVFAVGREGLAGIDAWLGIPVHFGRLVQRAPGRAVRMTTREFCDALDGSRKARRLLQAFSGYMGRAVQQGAVCNALHSVEQRTCRWLLATADRVGSGTLPVTQEVLADLLGVRRQSVGEVAVVLQQSGLIAYRRSDVTVLDRDALERRACECRRVVAESYAAIVEPLL